MIQNNCVDDPLSTFKDGEVRAMCQDRQKEQLFWEGEHQ